MSRAHRQATVSIEPARILPQASDGWVNNRGRQTAPFVAGQRKRP
jgi:hypothetical protein